MTNYNWNWLAGSNWHGWATGGVENRRRTRHGSLGRWSMRLAGGSADLPSVERYRKAAGNPVKGKRSVYRRGTRQDQRGSDRDRATHQPRRIGRGMAPAVELDDGIGLRDLEGRISAAIISEKMQHSSANHWSSHRKPLAKSAVRNCLC